MRFSSFFQYPDLEDQNEPDDLTLLGDSSEEEWAKLIDHTQRRQFEADETIVTCYPSTRSIR